MQRWRCSLSRLMVSWKPPVQHHGAGGFLSRRRPKTETLMAKPYLQLARPLPAEFPASREFMVTKLAASGLTPEDLGAYPVAPLAMSHVPGFLIPYHDPNMYRIRYDRLTDKYIGPKGRTGIWWSPHDDISTFRESPMVFIVEGELKAAALRKRFPGTKVLGIGGCWMFLEHGESGVTRLMPDILRAIRPGQVVCVIFDGDIEEKISIQQAAHTLNGMLELQGTNIQLYKAPIGKGVDDWLVADPLAQLSHLKAISIADLEISRKNLYKKLKLKTNEKGTILLNELNAKFLLMDHYSGTAFKDRRLGYIYNGSRLEADLALKSLEYLQDQISGRFSLSVARTATELVFVENEKDLVQQLVGNLEWDGVPRLNTWATDYFESAWPEYTAEWGRLLMTGLALRILRPGTKVDHCCILVGGQGIGKSTFFEELSHFGGFDFYHACTALTASEGDQARTQGTAFKKAIVVDLAEGVVFNSRKSNMDTIKQIVSQTSDEFREVFSKTTLTVPRGFIFVGTTNRRDQLSDLTGSRRFLNLEVTKIKRLPYDLKLQLIAEVVAKEDEIRTSNWYDLRVDVSTAPDELRSEHEHISNAQVLVNTQYHKPNAIVDRINDLIAEGHLATVKLGNGTERQFITAKVAALRMGETNVNMVNMVSRQLSQLSSSPAMSYSLKLVRVRVPQLNFSSPQLKEMYLDQYTDPKRMLSGYIVEHKDVQPMRSSEALRPDSNQIH